MRRPMVSAGVTVPARGRAKVLAAVPALVAALGCASDTEQANDQAPEQTPAMQEARAPARVTIVEPAHGTQVDAGPVVFRMETEGLQIVAAGVMDAGTGHHHLIVNGDVDWTLPIPNDPGVHYHMGQAQTEFTIEDLPPGTHRIIAVVADGVHIPLDPPVADTITLTVR